jgi:hypothetical protein
VHHGGVPQALAQLIQQPPPGRPLPGCCQQPLPQLPALKVLQRLRSSAGSGRPAGCCWGILVWGWLCRQRLLPLSRSPRMAAAAGRQAGSPQAAPLPVPLSLGPFLSPLLSKLFSSMSMAQAMVLQGGALQLAAGLGTA